MAALSHGELDLPVLDADRRDEIGEMARTVEVFKGAMIETNRLRAEQLEVEQRQLQQRKSDMHRLADDFENAVGEIINQVAKMQYMSNGRLKMPILLRGCIGINHSAATHHSGSYYPMYAHFPGLRVVVPSSPADAKGSSTQCPATKETTCPIQELRLGVNRSTSTCR